MYRRSGCTEGVDVQKAWISDSHLLILQFATRSSKAETKADIVNMRQCPYRVKEGKCGGITMPRAAVTLELHPVV